MNRLLAVLLLLRNFLRDVVTGGWATARLTLSARPLRPGLVRMAYDDLPEEAAVVLGVLITLTPGTTTVDIDPQRREFLLHMLDVEHADAALSAIRRDFVAPVAVLFGGRP